eukprot:Plantae.Rhodophyta-Purpureofilum_apyrenoidigerum.ctg10594.p1 GENE.Plantae.Rhodophyta-Purpureofilum_apyrenoidigerum.ctg10594~~Plantae.Rhodophyta-Purpureofilum_apyrenoidigerum.ctg10594.p1  ORF type:complete len:360 (+),score=65.99 Plantae.Rhodophyta-Purpureofilum_apyrenoidigerum.ctg10594:185-1264(+)
MWQRRLTPWLLRRRGGCDKLDMGINLRNTVRNHQMDADPFRMCMEELKAVTSSVQKAMREYESSPVLRRAAEHFFSLRRDRFRPVAVLLIARVAADEKNEQTQLARLAEVAEMLHIASVLHDDVHDAEDAKIRGRGINNYLGNGLSLLAGDFLLARSVTLLAELRNCEVVEKMSNVVEAMVHGEVLHYESPNSSENFEDYLRKSYLKTAFLLANSAASVMILANKSSSEIGLAFDYGKHLGMAYRLAADARRMDYLVSSVTSRQSLKLALAGSASGPLLHAADSSSSLKAALSRGFEGDGDGVYRAVEEIQQSRGIERTAELALTHAGEAISAVSKLTDSPQLQSALANLVNHVVKINS